MLQSEKSVESMVLEAKQQITSLTPHQLQERIDNQHTIVIDIRDIRELHQLGKIPQAVHMPRGMLEFWFDANSPYYQQQLLADKTEAILYCAKDWRSALATKTLQDMGVAQVMDLQGGFMAWQELGFPIEPVAKPSAL